MNEKDALTLILYAGEKWGAAAAVPTDPNLLELRVQVWMDALSDIDTAMVRSVLAQSRDEFPPNVATIRRRCDELTGNQANLPSWDEFWPWVRSVARRCTDFLPERVGSDEASVDCPWPSLNGLVNVPMVAGWARDGLTEHDLEMVIQAHVRRLFDARCARADREGTSDVPALSAYREQIAALAESKTLALEESA